MKTLCAFGLTLVVVCIAGDATPRSLRADEQGDAGASAPGSSAQTGAQAEGDAKVPKKLYAGQVVLVREALARRGISAHEELDGQVALETADGQLLPIVPDWRGRAFFQDERLRNRPVELIGTRRDGLAYLQVLVVFVIDEDGTRQYMDYWCDICSIPMYEIKPCDCCQQEIRLRLQLRELPEYITSQSSGEGSDSSESPE